MIFGIVLCVLIAASSACSPDAQTNPQATTSNAVRGVTTRSLKKRSAGCNPVEVIIEAVTKIRFTTPDENEKTDRAIRAKILELLAEKEVQTEKYGEYVHSKTSNNGFLTLQYAFANSMQYCNDFMRFGEIGVKEIPEIGKVIVTCGCEQPETF